MLNLLTASRMRDADQFIIQNRQMPSIELMESACRAFVALFVKNYPDQDLQISIYCGTGNNGGDGLGIARLLKEAGYEQLSVHIARFSSGQSEDFTKNLERLHLTGICVTEIFPGQAYPADHAALIIDALLGSGLTRPLDGAYKMLVSYLNSLSAIRVAVDVPTGFPCEGVIDPAATILSAHLVISFQRPKINFYFPESGDFVGRFLVADIGLDEDYIRKQADGWKLTEESDVKLLKARKRFSHKGSYGHALIVAGSADKMGAALLCADACLHSGVGLTTCFIPEKGRTALNVRSPEIMTLLRDENASQLPPDLSKFQSVAVGPGLGTGDAEAGLLTRLVGEVRQPMVIDADGLNLLAADPGLLHKLPSGTVLTPHMKEFDRLFGEHPHWWSRVATARKKAAELNIVIVLKNQYTFIADQQAEVRINPTGNPAMAVGGMGDVLTGMLAAFLAQGYSGADAAMLACYLHGKAGDELKEKSGMFCIPPRYLIEILPQQIGQLASPD